jgi:hypothetical protein
MSRQAETDVLWEVVQDCLESIFGLEHAEAIALREQLRTTLAGSSHERAGNLFYHAEPIDVASDLAGRKRPLAEADWKKYDTILARHGW